MKRVLISLIIISIISLSVAVTLADTGMSGIHRYEKSDEPFTLRGYLQWGMSADEVQNGLSNEKHNGKKMCSDILKWPSSSNKNVTIVAAKAIVGNYNATIYCFVSDIWGLYSIQYRFSDEYSLSLEEYKDWKTSLMMICSRNMKPWKGQSITATV